jgi:hypothetical protein
MTGYMLHRLHLRPLLFLFLAATASGCSDLAAGTPLAEARRSPEALARAALDAIEAGDEERLAGLMISREEYETLLWPVLPDRNQMPFEFVWSITAPRSRKARRNALADYQGVPLELVRVEIGDDVEAYDAFVLHRRARMWVRRADTGDVGVLPLMDTLVQMDGGWKFMNFVDGA